MVFRHIDETVHNVKHVNPKTVATTEGTSLYGKGKT